jgi:hypothetical protein
MREHKQEDLHLLNERNKMQAVKTKILPTDSNVPPQSLLNK